MLSTTNFKDVVLNSALACELSYERIYAGEAYATFKTVNRFVKITDGHHVEGMFCTDYNDNLYVVFQGSIGVWDWLDNFKFWKKGVQPYDNKSTPIRVHAGFMAQYKTIRGFVHSHITSTYKKCFNNEIIFCGHSLGGALAVLAGVDCEYNFKYKPTVITFGCPRLGNKAFRDSTNKRIPSTYQFVLNDDIVTNLPPQCFGYKDLSSFTVTEPESKAWWQRTPWGRLWNHDISKYARALRRNMKAVG